MRTPPSKSTISPAREGERRDRHLQSHPAQHPRTTAVWSSQLRRDMAALVTTTLLQDLLEVVANDCDIGVVGAVGGSPISKARSRWVRRQYRVWGLTCVSLVGSSTSSGRESGAGRHESALGRF